MTSDPYSCIIPYISEHNICYKLVLFPCSVDQRLRVKESGSEIVSANVSTEPSCERAASSSLNSLPGGSFVEGNDDMNNTSTEPSCGLLRVLL